MGVGVTTIASYKIQEQNVLTLLASSTDSIDPVKSEEPCDWNEIIAPILRENESIMQCLSVINDGFREWIMQDGDRYLGWMISLDKENSTKMYLFQFLSEKPKYQDYLKQYVDMLSEIYASMVSPLSQNYCDLFIERAEVTGQWEYNETINGTEYTFICTSYELSINGTVQRLVKGEVYDSKGVLIADPYAGLWLFYIPMNILGQWIIIGEEYFANIRFTYPIESDIWFGYMIYRLYIEPLITYESLTNYAFGSALGFLAFSRIAAFLAGTYLWLGLSVIPEQEKRYFAMETTYAWMMSAYDNFGIQFQMRLHYIYPAYDSYLSSYIMYGYVLFNGVYVQALPNPYTKHVPVVTVAGIVGYEIANALTVEGLRSELLKWGAFYGLYHMVWFGLYLSPPKTSISLSGTQGLDGWYTSNVIINLSATHNIVQNISTVARIEYSYDGTTWFNYTEPLIIMNEGITIIYYRLTNFAGYVWEINTETIKVDKTSPITDLIIGAHYVDEKGNIYVTSATEFTLIANDIVSSVSATYYRIDDCDWIVYAGAFNITGSVGNHTIEYYSVDAAGNKERVNSVTIILEEEFKGYGVLRTDRQWFNGNVRLFRSENLIRVEVEDQIATWNIVKQWGNQGKRGDLEFYFGEGKLGRVILMICRGETSSHACAIGKRVFFCSWCVPFCCLLNNKFYFPLFNEPLV